MPGRPLPEDLCRLLGLRHPIIQAPMAGVQGHELAAAASRAGALGSLPSATFSAADAPWRSDSWITGTSALGKASISGIHTPWS